MRERERERERETVAASQLVLKFVESFLRNKEENNNSYKTKIRKQKEVEECLVVVIRVGARSGVGPRGGPVEDAIL